LQRNQINRIVGETGIAVGDISTGQDRGCFAVKIKINGPLLKLLDQFGQVMRLAQIPTQFY
jgi:hypothetical protein